MKKVSVVIPTYNRKNELLSLIESILNSNYPKNKLEIIVIDDASTDGTYDLIRKKYPSVKIIRNKKNLLLANSRNIGIKNSVGDYVFLIDDDNVIDKNCIFELVKTMEKDNMIGVLGPTMYYLSDPKRIWCAGIRRNMVTSSTLFIYKDKIDNGKIKKLIPSDDFPNAFMVRRKVFYKVGLLNHKEFPIHYDEADFCQRVKQSKFRIFCNTDAKIWHNAKRTKFTGFETYSRTYFTARNRIIFHFKYSNLYEFIIFVSIFNWIILLFYIINILLKSDFSLKKKLILIKAYFSGTIDAFNLLLKIKKGDNSNGNKL
ncbi:MAG: glycosyltransferase family 2 protein [Candidatus Aenigmatarchaeota archaeon]